MIVSSYDRIIKGQRKTRANKKLGFKWLGVRPSRLQAFCTVDKLAST